MNSTSVGDLQHTVLVDEPRTIDVASIEAELTSLWKQTAVASDDEMPAVIRACSLNVVVWTDNDRDSAAIDRLLGDMTVTHPSRIFLVTAECGSSAPSLEAWVSARCSIPLPGEKQVCCEQINLIAKGTEVIKVSSVITSLLVPDVPVVLFWKTSLEREGGEVQSLIRVSDHVLIDSSDDLVPLVCFRRWERVIEGELSGITFRDLAWAKLGSWRTLVTDHFELPSRREQLGSLKSVTIEYSIGGSSSSGLSPSMLLLGWLAHSLAWVNEVPLTRGSEGIYTASFRFGEESVIARIVQREENKETEGRVGSITMEFGTHDRLRIEGTADGNCARVTQQSGTGSVSEDLLSTGNRHADELLAHELDILDTDDLYVATVKILLAMSGEVR